MERSTESYAEFTHAKDRETVLKYKIIKELLAETGLYFGTFSGLALSFMIADTFATSWVVDLASKHLLGVMLLTGMIVPRFIIIFSSSSQRPADWKTHLSRREETKLRLVNALIGLVCGFLPFAFVSILLFIFQGHL